MESQTEKIFQSQYLQENQTTFKNVALLHDQRCQTPKNV